MKLVVDFRAGLVDDAEDGGPPLRHAVHQVHDVLGHPRVEPGRGLVAEEQRRVRDHLGGEGEAAHLPAGDALDAAADPDQGAGALAQAELPA